MIKRFYPVFSLILLLLFAQQTALLHPYEHLNTNQNQHSAPKQSNKESPVSASFCEKCAAYAALGNALTTSHTALTLFNATLVFVSEHAYVGANYHTSHYAARAPPYLPLA